MPPNKRMEQTTYRIAENCLKNLLAWRIVKSSATLRVKRLQ